MRKIYFLLSMLGLSVASMAQTVTGGDMETWRTTTHSGSISPVPLEAPYGWKGSDSLVIAYGQTYGLILGISPTAWKRQIFKSTTHNGGSFSAAVLTRKQDTLGNFPGYLTNSNFSIPISLSGGTPSFGTPSYSGGQAVTQRITSVSAYVQYMTGVDSATGMLGAGIDTALLTVQARGHLLGADTTVGTGIVQILPTSGSFVQVTANLVYFDTTYVVDTIRMVFASSGGGRSRPCDSSTLYVDDVTMTGVPNYDHTGVKNVTANDVVKIYPNPSTGMIYFDAPKNAGLNCQLYAVSGKVAASQAVNAKGMDVSYLPGGLYFYAITDESGNTVQRGKITLSK
jgi:hypothetical protein